MKHLRKFNENTSDPTIDKFISIVNKHFNEDDVTYLGDIDLYEYINSDITETYNEMKKRLGEYAKYIYEGIMGPRIEEVIDEIENKMFSINGHLFKVSDSLLATEHNLDRFIEQLKYEDEDEEFIDSLDLENGEYLLGREDLEKLYSKWDQNY